MTEHEWRESVGAYLLGALDSDEVTDFEAHLEGCADCRDEVARLQVAADALPASPVQLVPPPELKDRIMAIVNSEAELLSAAGSRADRPPAPRRVRWSFRPVLALAGATAVLAIGLVVGLAMSGDETRTTLADVAPAGAKVELIERDSGHSTLTATGLEGPGALRVYQVWLKRRGSDPEPTNALFGVRPDGSASVDVPGSLEGVEQVLVTSEPEGGSMTPSRPPVIVASPA